MRNAIRQIATLPQKVGADKLLEMLKGNTVDVLRVAPAVLDSFLEKLPPSEIPDFLKSYMAAIGPSAVKHTVANIANGIAQTIEPLRSPFDGPIVPVQSGNGTRRAPKATYC